MRALNTAQMQQRAAERRMAALQADPIWKQTFSGRAFPLHAFTAADIDLFVDIPEALARVCRYGGHVHGAVFSVAQHCVMMADAAIEEIGDPTLAAHCLLHDAHEAYFGDLTTPIAHWMRMVESRYCGTDHIVATVITASKTLLDKAIWQAAGIAEPGATVTRMVKDYDLRMLATERRQLLVPSPCPWGNAVEMARPIRLRGRLSAWPIGDSVAAWLDRLDRLCPGARRPA